MDDSRPVGSPVERVVPCPRCGQDCRYSPDNPYRPFCSARCKSHDLGAWASEHFRLEEQHSRIDSEGLLEH